MTLGLGIDTSFDDTAVAIVKDGREIISNLTVSQFADHEAFGGVLPERASRLHIEVILPLLEQALRESGITLDELDYCAVTNRPGLMGSLLVGVTTAKTLAIAKGLPLIGVNHLEAHVYAAHMEHEELNYPYLSLLISGANTLIFHHRSADDFTVLGQTLDDAVGECIDKCGRQLGLPMPAGPALQELALSGDPTVHDLPRPMLRKPGLSMSFSGLKTAVLYLLRDHPEANRSDVAASLLQAIAEVLASKVKRAAEATGTKTIVLCGGAAANLQIRECFQLMSEKRGLQVLWPSVALCTDNAAMIAGAGHEAFLRGDHDALDLPVRATVSWKAEGRT